LIEKKKICLVIPSLQAGGMERVMSELAGYFASKSDFELHLILYGISREIFFHVPESIEIHTPNFRFSNRWRIVNSLRTLYYLRNTIKSINPDSLLSFGEYWNSFVLIAVYGLKYPVFISDRCSPEKTFSTFHSFLRKMLYPRAEGIIAQTAKAKEIYHNQFRHKNIKVIGNPIREIIAGTGSERQNIVLMVGRLIKSKNQDKLIEIFLNISLTDWKLVIVGYDHLQQKNYDRLLEIIKQNKAEQRVLLEGKQADVEKYYLNSKIFAFTSGSEGFPNAVGEAMSAGLPVVAFDCVAGPAEMIRDNYNGFLIPLYDYKYFQEKLEMLMSNEDLRSKFGENAKEDIQKFSINHIGEQLSLIHI